MSDNIHVRVKELVSQDKIDEAIELLFSRFNPYLKSGRVGTAVKKSYNSLVRISSRLRRLERDSREGILDHDEISRQRSKLLMSFIDYVDDLPTSVVELLEYSSENKINEIVQSWPEKSEDKNIDREGTGTNSAHSTQFEDFKEGEIFNKGSLVEGNANTRGKSKTFMIGIVTLTVVSIFFWALKAFNANQDSDLMTESLRVDVEELLKLYLFEDAFTLVDSVRNAPQNDNISNRFLDSLITYIKVTQESVRGRVGFLPIGDMLKSSPTFLKNSNLKSLDFTVIENLSDINVGNLYMANITLPLYAQIDSQRMINNDNIVKFIPTNSSFRALKKPISIQHEDANRPIFWLYIELITSANPIFEQEPLNIDTIPDSLRNIYLEDSTLLFKVEYFPDLPSEVSSSRDTSGAYLYPFVITKNSNRYFVSVAAYNSFYYAVMQRKNLLNLGYLNCKVVLYNNKFVVSLADFETNREVSDFISKEKENFQSLYAFRYNK